MNFFCDSLVTFSHKPNRISIRNDQFFFHFQPNLNMKRKRKAFPFKKNPLTWDFEKSLVTREDLKGQAPSLGSSETGVVERLALAPSALRVLGAPRLRH